MGQTLPRPPELRQTPDQEVASEPKSRRGLIAGTLAGLLATGAIGVGIMSGGGETAADDTPAGVEQPVDDAIAPGLNDGQEAPDPITEDSSDSPETAVAADYEPALHSVELEAGEAVLSAFLQDVENYINHQPEAGTSELIEPLFDISTLYADYAPSNIFEEWEEDRQNLHSYIQQDFSDVNSVSLRADVVSTDFDGESLEVVMENFEIDTASLYSRVGGVDRSRTLIKFGKDDNDNTIVTELIVHY